MTEIMLTERAVDQLRHLLARVDPDGGFGLRIGVDSFGWTERYRLSLGPGPAPGEDTVHCGDIAVFLGAGQAPLIDGVRIDYRQTPSSAGFTFHNPRPARPDPPPPWQPGRIPPRPRRTGGAGTGAGGTGAEPGPTTSPNAAATSPYGPTASPNAATASPNGPTTSPNAPTTSPNAPTTSPNAATASPNGPTASPNAPTASPNAATTSPNAATTSPRGPAAGAGLDAAEPEGAGPMRGQLWDRVTAALEQVRPYLQRDGGDAELVEVDGDTAWVELTGACAGCSAAEQTLVGVIERWLTEAVDGLSRVEVARW